MHKKSASELATMLRNGETSSVELTKLFLDRAEKLNPLTNSFLQITRETALAQAEHADKLIAEGKAPSALTGVPIAVKDNLTTTDAITTAGSKILENYLPQYDSTVVKLQA
jgi:Asp-tRNAAsn/Glu-tRNAGln amidotransferase A subunit and related amidases